MTQLADPTDLDGLRQALKPLDPEGRLKPLGLKRVVISGTAHLAVAAALREALGRPGSERISRLPLHCAKRSEGLVPPLSSS